jgi:tRNA splicing ligase
MVPKKGLRQWDEDTAKIIDDKRNAFKKYVSSKSIEDKIEYSRKKVTAKGEVTNRYRDAWHRFLSSLETDITKPIPIVYKVPTI